MFPGYSAQFTPYTYPSQPGFFDPSSQQMIPGPSSTNSNSPPTQPDFYAQPAGASVSSFGGLRFEQFPDMMTCLLKPVHLIGPVTYSASPIHLCN